MKYRKKPVVIEAVQYDGEALSDLVCICGCVIEGQQHLHQAHIHTLEGAHLVSKGDWIITGIRGEHYPCKPDIFAATHEAVRE